jgi:hypothetical protein
MDVATQDLTDTDISTRPREHFNFTKELGTLMQQAYIRIQKKETENINAHS